MIEPSVQEVKPEDDIDPHLKTIDPHQDGSGRELLAMDSEAPQADGLGHQSTGMGEFPVLDGIESMGSVNHLDLMLSRPGHRPGSNYSTGMKDENTPFNNLQGNRVL